MLPKNSKHYIIPTAEELNIETQLVEDVVSFYYSTLRKSLSGLSFPVIRVENLCSFIAKNNELPKLVAKYKKHLSVIKPEKFNYMTIKKDTEEKLESVLALQRMIAEERERKRKFIERKKNGNIRKNI